MARDSFSKTGCILNLVIFVYVVYILFQVVPVLYNKVELQSEMDRVARSYHMYRHDPNKMKVIIFNKAKELEIPISSRDITIQRRAKSVNIIVNYDIEFDLLFTKKKWRFTPKATAPVIDF